MEEKQKSSVGLVVLVVILLLACVGMGAFIFVNKDKLISKESTQTTNKEEEKGTAEKTETTKENEKETAEKTETTKANEKAIETRECTGVYSGTAAITQDARTGQYGKGNLTIKLKSDGTYELKKANANGAVGSYTIIENALLLKTTPEVTGPGVDGSAQYSHFLNISSDCSTISWGYGSYFFDSDFTLTKTN